MEDLHERWPHRWLNPKLRAQESAIHGLGTFATETIARGEVIAVYGGVVVPCSEIAEYRTKIPGLRGIQISDDFFLCPTERKGGLFNHSCEPKCGYRDSITTIAITDIKPGEEVTAGFHFTESVWGPMKCKCGAPLCRGKMTPDDWKNPVIQEQYGEYFSPYLKEKWNKLNQNNK
jgi:uncharacterized protein